MKNIWNYLLAKERTKTALLVLLMLLYYFLGVLFGSGNIFLVSVSVAIGVFFTFADKNMDRLFDYLWVEQINKKMWMFISTLILFYALGFLLGIVNFFLALVSAVASLFICWTWARLINKKYNRNK